MKNFHLAVRVYIEDTDAGGIVYYANYLRYLERARTEWLRSVGVGLETLQKEHRRIFVVRAIQLDYLNPARLDDQLDISVEIQQLKSASLSLAQSVSRTGGVLATGVVKLACLDADTLSPVRIPTAIKEAISLER